MPNNEVIYQRTIRPHRALSLNGQRISLYLLLVLGLLIAPSTIVLLSQFEPRRAFIGAGIIFSFLLMPVLLLRYAHARRNHDSQISEQITMTRDQLLLIHTQPNGKTLEFKTDPYWVHIEMNKDGPVENYLTLRDHERHVEMGRFLSPDERMELYEDLIKARSKLR